MSLGCFCWRSLFIVCVTPGPDDDDDESILQASCETRAMGGITLKNNGRSSDHSSSKKIVQLLWIKTTFDDMFNIPRTALVLRLNVAYVTARVHGLAFDDDPTEEAKPYACFEQDVQDL